MSAIEAIILGVVQGLTEFLPISSTAHVRIVPAFLGWKDPGAAFTAVIQLGTMAAVVIYFRSDLLRIAKVWIKSLTDAEARKEHDAKMGWYIILGTIPVGIFGLIFKHQIETAARSLWVIGTVMILFSLVMAAADATAKRVRNVEDLNRGDAIFIGLWQALALVPGVSRSGSTITAGLFRGLDEVAAARYSFLLSIPAVVASGLFELKGIGADKCAHGVTNCQTASVPTTVIATLAAFGVGYWAIGFLLKWLSTHNLKPFVIYRVLILAASGTIS
ncbi:MAG: undecaprenyl-diphosphate phosphatase [Solirubrobacterales bacterium]|nr:undecaprenyl-diphosphate phosphatase [Solirubrobacterales bacterium]